MASGAKSKMPEMIFVIFNGYEVRYYTTIESFAAALTDGYAERGSEIKCFVPAEWADDNINQAVLKVTKHKPFNFKTHPQWQQTMFPHGYTGAPFTPAQEAFAKQEEKRQKAERKAHKDKIVAELTDALKQRV